MIPRIICWWATANSGRGKVSDLATSKIVPFNMEILLVSCTVIIKHQDD